MKNVSPNTNIYDQFNIDLRETRSKRQYQALRKKCPYSEFFWSAFSRIWTEYGEILPISPYSVQMWENADQNNYEYGHF